LAKNGQKLTDKMASLFAPKYIQKKQSKLTALFAKVFEQFLC